MRVIFPWFNNSLLKYDIAISLILKSEAYMVLEFAMISTLAGMGVYFVKSSDLPKELKERSKQLEQENVYYSRNYKSKFNFPKIDEAITQKVEVNLEKEKVIEELMASISKLENEIKQNIARNNEVQRTIVATMVQIQTLKNA
jgi:hypothetical protein